MNLESTEWDECFAELLEVAVFNNPQIERKQALCALKEREEKMSTAVFPRVAVPHANCDSIKKTEVVLGISQSGIEFDSIEGSESLGIPSKNGITKVNLVFEILFEENNSELHLHLLKDILELAKNPEFLDDVLKAKTSDEVYRIIKSLEN